MITKPADIIRPAYLNAECDARRYEFDFQNEQLVTYGRTVDVLFIGDSITHLWELKADFPDFGLVINRGISGDRVQYVNHRFMGDAVQLKPRVTVLLIGVNNTWEACDGKMTPDAVYDLVCENYRQILNMAKENKLKMLLCSVQPTRCGNPMQDQLIQRINDSIKKLSSEFEYPYVDYYSEMVAEDGHTYPEMYSADGLHPNAVGYHKMAQVLRPYLERALA